MPPAIGPVPVAIRVDLAAIGFDLHAAEGVHATRQFSPAAKQFGRVAIRFDPAAIGLGGQTTRFARAADKPVRGGIELDGAGNKTLRAANGPD